MEDTNKCFKILIGLLSVMLVIVILSIRLIDKRIIVDKVVKLGIALSSNKDEELHKYFTENMVFIYKNKITNFNEIKDRILNSTKVNQIKIDSNSFYLDKIEEISISNAEISIIGWVEIKQRSLEINIKGKLKRTGFFRWDFYEMSSDNSYYNIIFGK